jgi:hypothetical protein
MAGNRQHILPRFLLKGFASRVTGSEVFTWVYRKEANVFEANIINVGVEKNFYGREGEVTADAEITNLENEFAILLDELRRKSDQSQIHDPKLAEFVAHLCVRTRHLRESFRESSEVLLSKISEHLFNAENLKAFVSNHPELMTHELEKVIAENPLLEPYAKMLLQMGPTMAIAFFEGNKSDIEQLAQPLISNLKSVLPRALKEGHIKALAKAPIPELRVEDYRILRWFVCESDDPLVLGDIGCLFETAGARRFKSLSEKNDEIRNIYLPIMSNRMLVGTALSSAPRVDFKLIENAMVTCSREFFVCSESSQGKTRLLRLIGTESATVSENDLDQIMNELVRAMTG